MSSEIERKLKYEKNIFLKNENEVLLIYENDYE
jgi:hypothetical protein